MLARSDGKAADGGDDRSVAQSRLRRDDAVGNVMVNGLLGAYRLAFPHSLNSKMTPFCAPESWRRDELTECSSCLTSNTVPSLKVHFTISVSSEAPLTHSLLES
jgi:hypothetical protein